MERFAHAFDPTTSSPDLESLARAPIALFEQYEPLNDAEAPAVSRLDDAYENLYTVPC